MSHQPGKRKNILFVCDFPFVDAGGVGRVTEVLATEFMRRGYGVTYLAFCGGQEYETNGVKQFFVPESKKICNSKNINYLERMLDDLKIDVIVNQAGAKTEVVNFFAQAKIQTPVLSVHHNCVQCLQENYQHIITENFKFSPLFKLIDHALGWFILKLYHWIKHGFMFKKTIRVSARLVLLSDIFVPEMRNYVPDFPEGKVIGIPNPAPFAVVEGVERKKENRLVFVGRLNYQQKRADLLLELWKQIYAEYPVWHFDIVGDGPAKKELEEKAKVERLDRIHFHGFRDPRPFLEKAKFFCMTSAFEGYGMVLVEAQAYGVVPFAFNCFSALPEIIQSGRNGYVIPKFDIARYVQTLTQLMRDDALRKQMAMQAQVAVAKFYPAGICDKWEILFNAVEKERGAWSSR